MARTLGELFRGTNVRIGEDIVLYDELCDRLQSKAQQVGLDRLSPLARVVLLAERYDVGMCKSGWYTLMYWDDYDIMEMIPALEAIGAIQNAQILREVAALFPSGTIPTSVPQRVREYQEQVMCLEAQLDCLEERLKESREDVCRLAHQFTLAHRAELSKEEA